jgi:amino acid transporter
MRGSVQVQQTMTTPKIGFWGASSANMLCMIGIGPFLTIPLALAAMGGPQAMLGWILGAVISLCDGMVWSELGSAMPCSSGPYYYLLQAFGPRTFGRLFSFLFLWQAIVMGPITIASGAVGFAQYAGYLLPHVHHAGAVTMAAGVCLVNMLLLYRNIRSIAHLSMAMAVIVIGATMWVVWTGAMHFSAATAFDFPQHAFRLNRGFFLGLGSATLIAMYDYGGYFNVCLIGDEVRTPKKTIPRSVLFSIGVIAVLYLAMNISIIGVLPWRQAMHSQAIVADLMVHVYGRAGGDAIAILILVAAFGSVYAGLLGYSRIPYAAAVDGQFFSVFGRLHRKGNFPYVSVLAMGCCSAVACLFSLESLITALIVTQTLLQFAAQCVAVMVLRQQKRGTADCFRMPLYPLPALIALTGWMYIVVTSGIRYIGLAALFLCLGVAIFLVRARRQTTWPFSQVTA